MCTQHSEHADYFGKPCPKHPELKGKRFRGNSNCTECAKEYRSKSAANQARLGNEELQEAIQGSVEVDSETGCWEWQRSTADGYGQMWVNGKLRRTHRVSYEIFVGPVLEGFVVRHNCHNRLCCNPNHLGTGTVKDNFEDSRDKIINAMREGRASKQ